MPGYARQTNIIPSREVAITPSGNLVATNLADALIELDSDITSLDSEIISSASSKANVDVNGVIVQNNQTISSNYTIPSGTNGVSSGPITISDGVTVTISSGSDWSIV